MGTFCWVYRGYLRLERRGCLNIASESNFKILSPWTPWTSTSWCSMSSTPPEPAHYLHMIEHQSQLTVAFCIPKKVKSASFFLGQLWILRWDPWAWTGSLRSTYQGEILSLWLTGCPPKSPLRGHFPPQWMNRRVTLESDTRAWHKSVTPQIETCEGHQRVK